MATKYIEEYATEADFLADAVDAPGKLGFAAINGEYVVANKSGTVVELVDETRAQTLTNKTLTNPTIGGLTPVGVTGSSVSLGATHANRTTVLNRAAGVAVTLPAATGSGDKYRLVTGTALTSASTVVSPTGNDTMFGGVFINDTGDTTPLTADYFPAAAGNNTVTLAFASGAGKKGDWLEFEDIATDVWAVNGVLTGELDPVTPFSTV